MEIVVTLDRAKPHRWAVTILYRGGETVWQDFGTKAEAWREAEWLRLWWGCP